MSTKDAGMLTFSSASGSPKCPSLNPKNSDRASSSTDVVTVAELDLQIGQTKSAGLVDVVTQAVAGVWPGFSRRMGVRFRFVCVSSQTRHVRVCVTVDMKSTGGAPISSIASSSSDSACSASDCPGPQRGFTHSHSFFAAEQDPERFSSCRLHRTQAARCSDDLLQSGRGMPLHRHWSAAFI